MYLFFRQIFLSLLLCTGFISCVEANKVVLITGASRGIGASISDLLTHEGYSVYAGVRNIPATTVPDNLHLIHLDVTDQTSVDLAIKTIIAKEGHIDVLVNNAGIMFYGSIENITIEEAQKLFNVNFFGVMRVTQAVLPHMRDQKKGKVIQISSRSGFRPLPSIGVYAASKFALEGLSETMAAVLKPWNISISLIEPGPVSTELDFISPYGSRLPKHQDPYYSIFKEAGLLDPNSPDAQSAQQIAFIVKEVIETDKPLFRYQTADYIKKQASKRFIDISGNSSVDEWDDILSPQKTFAP